MKTPKLTISILISNKKEYIERCLESVRPLMNELDTELILTDTGCDSEIRRIMERYTNHIINFKWCNDFSAARNVGLQEAKGEWFLYLDDDEWFDDVSGIVEFLKSKESAKYNVACYIQRNYLDYDGTQYSEHIVDRILRINPKLHFEHRVHEAYTDVEIKKKKILSSFVHHYGYVYANEEERRNKYMRNQRLLELECAEFPDDMRMRYQYVINPTVVNDFEESIRLSFEAIDRESNSQYWDAIHTHILYCYEKLGRLDKIVEYGELFERKNLFPLDMLGVYQYLISAHWNLNNFEDASKYFSKAINLYMEYKKSPDIFDANQLLRMAFVDQASIERMFANGITAAVQARDRETVVLASKFKEEVNNLVKDVSTNAWMEQVFSIICNEDSKRELVDYFEVEAWKKYGKGTETSNEILIEQLRKILYDATLIVYFFRKQFLYHGEIKLSAMIQQLIMAIDTIGSDAIELNPFLEAQENDDKILMADILENQIIPAIQVIIQTMQKETSVEEVDYLDENIKLLNSRAERELLKIFDNVVPVAGCEYIPEYTACGTVTFRLAEGGKSYYLSGNNNPLRDALDYIVANTSDDVHQYSMFGIAMLWEAKALLECRTDVRVKVIEEDLYLLLLTLKYMKMGEFLLDDRIEIVYSNYGSYIQEISDCANALLMKDVSIRHCVNEIEAKALRNYYVKIMTIREQSHKLKYNFECNMRNIMPLSSVDECRTQIQGKRVFLVAGGPSLDKTIDILDFKSKSDIIMCVGTVAEKLYKAGIEPDYIIITDPLDDIYDQISHVNENTNTKLLYLFTANEKAVRAYPGEKYCICQYEMREAEELAQKMGYTLFNTGGSVSTTAIDICIKFKANEVICMGLDLAYTDNKSHADSTLHYRVVSDNKAMFPVEGVGGDSVYTIDNLDIYRKWIENRIETEHDIVFINISDGAFIKGMDNRTTNEKEEVINHVK